MLEGIFRLKALRRLKRNWRLNRKEEKKEIQQKKTKLKTELTQPKIEPSTDIGIFFPEEHDKQTFVNIRENPVSYVDKLDKEISMMIEKGGERDFILHTGGRKPYTSKGYTCKVCGVEMATRQKISNHIEGKHIKGYLHHCNNCSDSKTYSSRVSLSAHQSIAHKKTDKTI